MSNVESSKDWHNRTDRENRNRKTGYTNCGCGLSYKAFSLSFQQSHERSKTHMNFITYGKKHEQKSPKIKCECGASCTKKVANGQKHKESMRHKEYLKNKCI